MTTRLILIRHGETDCNRQGRYIGSADVPLNRRGRRQALALRRKLARENVARVYSSDSRRAFHFARSVFQGRTVEKLRGLREIDFGALERLTHREALEQCPAAYMKWLSRPTAFKLPRGEGFVPFRRRVLACLGRIVRDNAGKTAAVVTHGGPIRMILARKLGETFWRIKAPPAGVWRMECRAGRAGGKVG